MVFKGLRSAAAVFRAIIRSQHAVWVHDAEIDALFPLNIDRRQQDGFRTIRL
jgi:hypothetical protein